MTCEHSCDEYRSSAVSGSTFISGNTYTERKIEFAIIDGNAVFEGDIVLGPSSRIDMAREEKSRDTRDKQFSTKGIGILGSGFRWPNGRIPFSVDAALPNQARVTQAIQHWEANTFLRFVTRTTQPNFLTFAPGGGCSSNVGMIGGQQFIILDNGCDRGNTIHEIGHAVGLWHEQSRADRNNFVTIDYTNIAANNQHNFQQHIADGEDVYAYDYGSIMHYGAFAFAINPAQPTIISPQPIGQRNALSPGDIASVRSLYSINAGILHPNGKAYFFRDDRYQRFDFNSDRVDKNARTNSDGWRGLDFGKIDAAVMHPNGRGYFFRRNQYKRFDFASDRVDKTGTIGTSGWSGLWTTGIDAAVSHPNGRAYFFRGNQYQRYNFRKDTVDKTGRIGIDGWSGLWISGVDSAVNHPNGKAYFFRGNEYQRFDFTLNRVDKTGRIGTDGWRGVWPSE